ncbi:hypothetical protein AWENTII_003817 [Aspergillus wentii]
MTATEPSRYLARSLPRVLAPSARPQSICWRRNASDQASSRSPSDINELESASSLSGSVPENVVKSFDPVSKARLRKTQLPRSRYQFRSPKYDRGPLHPPPAPSAVGSFFATFRPRSVFAPQNGADIPINCRPGYPHPLLRSQSPGLQATT